jgi:dipeptidyl aminopeptidase/acylaminoacyl peptidase
LRISNHEPDPDRAHNYDIFAVRVEDGRVRQLTKTKGCEYAPAWSADGSTIAYLAGVRPLTTQESSAEDPHVWVIPAQGGTGRQLAASLDRRAMSVGWAAGEPTVYFTVQDHGSTTLYRVGADDRGLVPVVGDKGQVGAWSAAKSQLMAYAFHSPSAPAEVFIKAATQPARRHELNAELLAARDVSCPKRSSSRASTASGSRASSPRRSVVKPVASIRSWSTFTAARTVSRVRRSCTSHRSMQVKATPS